MKSMLLFLLCLSTITPTAFSQDVHWDSTKNWKIYEPLDFQKVFNIHPDSMALERRLPLNDDSIRQMLLNSTEIKGVNPMWMGCYLASFETSNGSLFKVAVSQYGGFFYIPDQRRYFEVKPALRQGWLQYFTKNYLRFYDKQ